MNTSNTQLLVQGVEIPIRITYRAFTLCCLLAFSFLTSAFADESQELPIEKLRIFSEAFGRIQSDFIKPVDGDKLIDAAISGMVTNIDPTGAYLDQKEFRELQIGQVSANMGGIGTEVGYRAGRIVIVSPIEGAPAYRAGIKAGDYFIRVDGKDTNSVSLKELIALLRGRAGSPIEIAVEREGVLQPLVFRMKREAIRIQSVKPKLIEPGYGYIRITQFQENTGALFVEALKTLYRENKLPLDGLVLDMRNNPGGLLTTAIVVSAFFLPDNALVTYTEGRSEDARMRLTASKEHMLRGDEKEYWNDLPPEVKRVPLVVLVNRGSVAGPEIVAGALQDHKRATIMGETTFGNARLYTILPLTDGSAIKITTAHWHTPNGTEISGKGIKPDAEIPPMNPSSEKSQIGEQDEQIYKRAIELLKAMPK